MSKLVFIHGPPACGKLTIAKVLVRLTQRDNFQLFHNHLTVDLLLSLFPFGSSNFVKYRQQIWLGMLGDAIREGTNIVFTFNPENTVDPNFPLLLSDVVMLAGGTVQFVEIKCPHDVIVCRMNSTSRHECKKLTSAEYYCQLLKEGAFDFPVIPSSMSIDSSVMSPEEAARCILDELKL